MIICTLSTEREKLKTQRFYIKRNFRSSKLFEKFEFISLNSSCSLSTNTFIWKFQWNVFLNQQEADVEKTFSPPIFASYKMPCQWKYSQPKTFSCECIPRISKFLMFHFYNYTERQPAQKKIVCLIIQWKFRMNSQK